MADSDSPEMVAWIQSLIDEIKRLTDENHRLRLAAALRAWRPSPKKRGRPQKNTIERDIQLLETVERIQREKGFKTRIAVLRYAMENNPRKSSSPEKRRQEIDTLNKCLSVAKRERDKRDSSNK